MWRGETLHRASRLRPPQGQLPKRKVMNTTEQDEKCPNYERRTQRKRLSYRIWTFEEERKLKKWAGNLSVPEIAQLLGRTYKSVQLHANGMGICLFRYGERHQSAKYPDSIVHYVRKLHSAGWSPRRISQKYKLPFSVVKQWCYFQMRLNDRIILK